MWPRDRAAHASLWDVGLDQEEISFRLRSSSQTSKRVSLSHPLIVGMAREVISAGVKNSMLNESKLRTSNFIPYVKKAESRSVLILCSRER